MFRQPPNDIQGEPGSGRGDSNGPGQWVAIFVLCQPETNASAHGTLLCNLNNT